MTVATRASRCHGHKKSKGGVVRTLGALAQLPRISSTMIAIMTTQIGRFPGVCERRCFAVGPWADHVQPSIVHWARRLGRKVGVTRRSSGVAMLLVGAVQ